MSTTPTTPTSPNFIPVSKSDSITQGHGFKIRLISYNILAQAFIRSNVYSHSPSSCLEWNTRSPKILTILQGLEADILCLQELDQYDTFYKPSIERYAYSSIYVQKRRSVDGCGIFYKKNKLELLMEEKIYYNDMPKLNRDNVGIMAVFRLKDLSQRFLIVANTHIFWNPNGIDVKVAQVKYLLSCLAIFKATVAEKFQCTPLILVAGDFNSIPKDEVYEYIVSPNQKLLEREVEPIFLNSVYAYTKGEPEFTNCKPSFKETLDYIFFSPNGNIQPISFLEVPEGDSREVEGGLPNHYHPSDHLPIGADFIVI